MHITSNKRNYKNINPNPNPDDPFMVLDGNAMLINEMLRDSINIHPNKSTVRFKPFRFSTNWITGNIVDMCCDYIIVESGDDGNRYKLSDISPKRLRLI
jgi:hypothetical protein